MRFVSKDSAWIRDKVIANNHHCHKKGLRDPYSIRGLKGPRDSYSVRGSQGLRDPHSVSGLEVSEIPTP